MIRKLPLTTPNPPIRAAKPCPKCSACYHPPEVAENLNVCPECGHHYRIGARARVAQLCDRWSFQEWDIGLLPEDPILFADEVTYPERLASAQARTGLNDAVVSGSATVHGREIGLAVMDFGFLGGSMGEVVGEKIARAMERSAEQKTPFVAVTASGGARMQEGIVSLMQMAKTMIARETMAAERVLYLAVLTDPTMGGVMASFAASADVVVAEPGATIGFAGSRVIEQATHETLPPGFQTAEFMLEHGMIDAVVSRADLPSYVAELSDLYRSPV